MPEKTKQASILSIASIIAFGILAVIYVFYFVNSSERTSLQKRASTIAAALNLEDVAMLTGMRADILSQPFDRVHARLARIVQANPDIRFAYLAGKRDGNVVFLVDGEDPESEDYSPPGQVYYEASPDFIKSFETGESFIEGPYRDRWGNWISAIIPITDPEDGHVIAILGVDIDTKNYYLNLVLYSLVPILVTIILIGIAIFNRNVATREKENVRIRSEFIAVASHELRAPITGIKWMLQLFAENAENLSQVERETVGKIIQQCQKLLVTVNDILDVTALERGKFSLGKKTAANIYNLMRDSIESLSFSAEEKNIHVWFDDKNESSDESLTCDVYRMRMALSNILSNAIKYSPKDSKINISIEKLHGEYEIKIVDSGIGIPPKDQEKIFGGFFRSENAVRMSPVGTGLGLFYTKTIIEMHGGKITLESEENKGSTFRVILPIV